MVTKKLDIDSLIEANPKVKAGEVRVRRLVERLAELENIGMVSKRYDLASPLDGRGWVRRLALQRN